MPSGLTFRTITFGLSLFIFCFALPAVGGGDLHFERLPLSGEIANKNDNLSAVRATVKDKYGFIWFGGENGLARYDGQKLVIYQADATNPRSISANFIWALVIDHDGVMWVGTGRGLNRYNPETDDFDRFMAESDQLGNSHYIINNNINALAVDQDNNLIIGTANGLSIFNPLRTTFQNYLYLRKNSGLSKSFIRDVYVDSKNRIWVGSSTDGLSLFDLKTGKTIYFLHDPDKPDSLIDNDVSAIVEDHLGRLWVGTYGRGISRMNVDEKTFTHYIYDAKNPHSLGGNNIAYIHEDSRQQLWVAVDHGGLSLYQPATDSFTRYRYSPYNLNSLSSDYPRHIYEDEQGNLWIGMFPTGVTFLDRSAAVFSNYFHKPDDQNSLSNNGILAFMEDSDGMLWIGTENGLNTFDRTTGKFKHYFADNNSKNPSQSFGPVLTIEEDAQGNLWLGTWSSGLYRLNKKTGDVRHYAPDETDPRSISNEFVWKVLRDKNDTLWIATEIGGINRYEPATDSFVHYMASPGKPDGLISNQVWTLMEDKRGDIWVATLEGLDRLDKKTGKFTHYLHNPQQKGSISSNQIISLFEDSRGYIWVGTRDAGVNRFDPQTKTFKTLDIRDGLPSSTASSIIEDNNGYIWITTVNGIARIDPETFAIKTYNRTHGLVSNNFNRDATFKDAQGKLYVGSIGGFSVFDPNNMLSESAPPKIAITDFRIFNQTVPIGGENAILHQSILDTKKLTLNYRHLMFAFDVAALDYRSPTNHEYAYKLEGFDKDWIHIGNQRTATYTNIEAGRYTFRVKAANKDGVWNNDGIAIDIEIVPPLWQTWWAYFGYVLLLLVAFYMVAKYRDLRTATNIYRALSATDQLTGIANRTGLLQVIDDVFMGRKIQASLGLLVIDIDHFKLINDTRGHDSGDKVLREFAGLIANHIRAEDKFARWGGEEFVLLCFHVDQRGLLTLAEKLRNVVVQHVFEKDTSPLTLTVSIGVACVKPEEDFESAFKRADIALYEAKATTRNRVVVAE